MSQTITVTVLLCLLEAVLRIRQILIEMVGELKLLLWEHFLQDVLPTHQQHLSHVSKQFVWEDLLFGSVQSCFCSYQPSASDAIFSKYGTFT
jgi:hypothetical protein